MKQQKSDVFTAQVVFPQYVILGEKCNEKVDNRSDDEKTSSHIVYEKYDGGKSQVELQKIPDDEVNFVPQPGDQVLESLFIEIVEEKTYQAQNIQQNDDHVPQSDYAWGY